MQRCASGRHGLIHCRLSGWWSYPPPGVPVSTAWTQRVQSGEKPALAWLCRDIPSVCPGSLAARCWTGQVQLLTGNVPSGAKENSIFEYSHEQLLSLQQTCRDFCWTEFGWTEFARTDWVLVHSSCWCCASCVDAMAAPTSLA